MAARCRWRSGAVCATESIDDIENRTVSGAHRQSLHRELVMDHRRVGRQTLEDKIEQDTARAEKFQDFVIVDFVTVAR